MAITAVAVLGSLLAQLLLPTNAELLGGLVEPAALSSDAECPMARETEGVLSGCALSTLQLRGVRVPTASGEGVAVADGQPVQGSPAHPTALLHGKEEDEAEAGADKTQGNQSTEWPWTSAPKPGTCEKTTGATCLVFRCRSGRNSDCTRGRCACRPNFCSTSAGVCEIPKSTWKANVARVDARHPQFPKPHSEIDTAICLSGGGARAAALTIGVLRALENLKLMRKVHAISSVSGSTFVSINYMFADISMYKRRGELKDKDQPLWGRPSDPSKLTLASLDYDTSPFGTLFADGWGGTWGTAKDIVKNFIPHLTNDRRETDAAWKDMMRKQFLDPFGLGEKDHFLAADEEAVARIKTRNPQLRNFSFMLPRADRPRVFVICATILAPAGQAKTDAASFQISPDFTGAPFHTNIAHRPLYEAAPGDRLRASVVGGGLVETFAVGGAAPADQDGSPALVSLPSPSQPFTLADAIATATYADFLPGESTFGWTPTYKYWPIGDGHEPSKSYQIGDAGFIEDTGLLPMLQRRARRIGLFLFVGPGQQIDVSVDYCGLASKIKAGQFDTKTFEPSGKIADSIFVLFGYGYDDGTWHKKHNTVFKQAEMFSVACQLQKLKLKGKPLVYRTTHAVQPNEYWGIPGDYTVEIVYVYNDRIPEFEALLPGETQSALDSDLKGFPTDLPAGLFMKPRIIKLMAAQSEYMVLQNAQLFEELFSTRHGARR